MDYGERKQDFYFAFFWSMCAKKPAGFLRTIAKSVGPVLFNFHRFSPITGRYFDPYLPICSQDKLPQQMTRRHTILEININ